MNIELTDYCKRDFIKKYMEWEPMSDWKYPAYEFFQRQSLTYKLGFLTDFFDGAEYFIHVEPHIGGGAPVFYGRVHFRTVDYIDTWEEVLDNNKVPYYSNYRDEMVVRCLDICNRLYNENYDIFVTQIDYICDNEEDNLPF